MKFHCFYLDKHAFNVTLSQLNLEWNSIDNNSYHFDSDVCGSASQPQMQLTHEQQQILSHNIQQDHVVKIVAFAGNDASKTTTVSKPLLSREFDN